VLANSDRASSSREILALRKYNVAYTTFSKGHESKHMGKLVTRVF